MAIDALVKPLLGIELFKGLRPLQITEIARRAYRRIYKPGETIIEASAPGDAAVLIVSGEAVRVSGPDQPAARQPLPEGTLLAEMAMLIETEHAATVIAKTAVRALRIARSDMLEQMAEDPALAEHFVDRIAGRLQAISAELRRIDQTLNSAEATIEKELRSLSRNMPPPPAASAPALH